MSTNTATCIPLNHIALSKDTKRTGDCLQIAQITHVAFGPEPQSAKSVDDTPSGSPSETHQFGNLRKSADETPGGRHIFNQYVVRVPRRNELQAFLKEKGIGSEVYYPLPLHLQECFASLGYKPGDFPESEKAANETLALPVYPELTDDQAVYVVNTIKAFYGTGAGRG